MHNNAVGEFIADKGLDPVGQVRNQNPVGEYTVSHRFSVPIHGLDNHPVFIDVQMAFPAFAGNLPRLCAGIMRLHRAAELVLQFSPDGFRQEFPAGNHHIGMNPELFRIRKQRQVGRIPAEHSRGKRIEFFYNLSFGRIDIHGNLCLSARHLQLQITGHPAGQIKTVIGKDAGSLFAVAHKRFKVLMPCKGAECRDSRRNGDAWFVVQNNRRVAG